MVVEHDEQGYVTAMEKGEVMFVAVVDGRILSFSSFTDDGEVRAVYVHPSSTRQGVGRALTEAVEREAEQMGLRELHLDSSLTAVTLYVALGHEAVQESVVRPGSGAELAAMYMEKVL